MTKVLDIEDPDFLSRRHFSMEQKVFCNLELAALLLLNKSTVIPRLTSDPANGFFG